LGVVTLSLLNAVQVFLESSKAVLVEVLRIQRPTGGRGATKGVHSVMRQRQRKSDRITTPRHEKNGNSSFRREAAGRERFAT
jgi:hypothetical protein